MTVFTVHHRTSYRYRKPVSFGEHRLLMRPRDSFDQRHIASSLTITPPPSALRWSQDVFGNAVATAQFQGRSTNLTVISTLQIEHEATTLDDDAIEAHARLLPFSYDAVDMPDLQRSTERHFPDPAHTTAAWARSLLRTDGPTSTQRLLADMTRSIYRQCTYVSRPEPGIQAPHDTLRLGTGTCRDFAVLMMEAARCLGLAARFVTGYIYVAPRVPGGGTAKNKGGGNTHAWVQIYVPGPGWVDFDPTNNIAGSRDLIRVAAVREPRQAVPLSGSWAGGADDCIGMDVSVDVLRGGDPALAPVQARSLHG